MPRRAGNQRRKTPQAGKRYPLNMRTTFDIRAKLETAAAASGRSLAQEAEYRIDESFRTDELLGGTGMRGIAALMISSFNTAGAAAADIFVAEDEDWRRDRSCFIIGAAAVIENLMAAVPGEPFNPEQIESEVESLALGVKRRLMSQWEKYVARKEGGNA